MEYKGKILILQRRKHKPEGNQWGLPGGKIDQGENKQLAMVREIKEETGVKVSPENLEYLVKLYVKYPQDYFIYHIFRIKLNKLPKLKLSINEHKGYKWVTPKGAFKLLLIRDLDQCIKLFYKI